MSDKPKIIKKATREKTDDYKRQHEIALLKLLATQYPDLIQKLATELKAKAVQDCGRISEL